MPAETVNTYQIFYSPTAPTEGKITIKVLYNGGAHSYQRLMPDVAAFIVDMLRNESPIFIQPTSGTLQAAAEPVGEGE